MPNNDNIKTTIIQNIDINKLDFDLWDSRDYSNPETVERTQKRIDELARSITKEELHVPIIITQRKHNGHHSIVAGRLRTKAHQKLGLKTIKSIVTNETDKKKLEEITYSENYERLDLNLDDQLYRIKTIFADEGFTPIQVMHYAKSLHNAIQEKRDTKHIPKKFLRSMEILPSIGHENVRPSPNYLYQIMQTVVQIDPKVQQYMKKHNLKMYKRIMLTHSKLREHPEIQIGLIERIAALSPEKAKVEVNQAIRDLETKAIQKIDNNYVMDYSKREVIDTRIRVLKNSIENYQTILDLTNKMMYTLTGHKIVQGENKYERKHIDFSDYHRIDILKELTPQQIVNMHNDLTVLGEAITSILDIMEKKFSGTKEVNTI